MLEIPNSDVTRGIFPHSIAIFFVYKMFLQNFDKDVIAILKTNRYFSHGAKFIDE